MRKIITNIIPIFLFVLTLFVCASTKKNNGYYITHDTEIPFIPYMTTYVAPYNSGIVDEPELEELQCPIPMECRVRNHTGSQCVFSSIEMLGRWAEEPKLVDPPITSDSRCRSYSGPSHSAEQLKRLGVKFEQTYDNRENGLKLIKKAMAEGRGCLFGVPGHAMVLIHYSEEEDRACYVDNSDRSLKIQTVTIQQFLRKWGSWVMIIYADNDIIPFKVRPIARFIPIFNNGQRMNTPPEYIPLPTRD